jgi:MFS family permease
MLARYRSAFDHPGSAAFCVAGFVARFAIAIYPIGLVLIIAGRSGGYVFGGALGNPIAATFVDRLGQHRVLLPFMLGHIAFAVVVAVLITTRAPLWTLPVPAIGMGVMFLNVGALIRARWSYTWPGDAPQRSTAYSIESTLDEVIFVLGPLVATVLATHADPLVTLGLAVILIVFGSVWLAMQRDTEPPVRPNAVGQREASALRSRGMLLITLVMVFMGAVFGSAEVAMVAFCGQHGQRASAGWVVACFAGGSGLAGLVYGGLRWKTPLIRRFVISAIVFGVLPLLYFAASSTVSLALCTAVVGLGIAPTLIGGFGLRQS